MIFGGVMPSVIVVRTRRARRLRWRRQRMLANAPGRRRRFMRQASYRVLFEHAHRLLHGTLELRIMACDHVLGPVLDIDVRRRALILDRPFPFPAEETSARR